MPNVLKLRVNYYVGAMLAQGGEVWLDPSKIIFSPTSALDKAMGAKDIEIPFTEIRSMAHKGDLLRVFIIKTDQKTHKFEGSQAKRLADLVESALKEKGLMKNVIFEKKETGLNGGSDSYPSATLCHQCSSLLKPEYAFCPYCGTSIKPACPSCHRMTQTDWAACAYCGSKLKREIEPKVSNLDI